MCIDGHHNWNTEFIAIADMLNQIGQPLFHQVHIFRRVFRFQWNAGCYGRSAAMHFQCSNSGHQNNGVRCLLCCTTFDVEEFLHANVRTETSLSNTKTIPADQFQCNIIGNY